MKDIRPVALRLLVLYAVVLATFPTSVRAASLPPLPSGWPATFQLGMGSGPGNAADMRGTAPFAFRSQYLAGGVNTGSGWSTWNADGAFVTYYIEDSMANGITPVFDYYTLLQSNPAVGGDENAKDFSNLNNLSTMTAYYADLKLFFQRAGAFTSRVILQFEPDFWGFMQTRSSGDDAATVSAKVGSTGVTDIAGLPDNVAGFAQSALRLRDRYAPNVLVAYHMSIWGTGNDILYSKPSDSTIDALAGRAGAFYRSLNANFDIAFVDPSDRDAAFKQYVYGDGGGSWWGPAEYARDVRFIGDFVASTSKRVILWQIPFGNTRMRAMNNTWGHYQDNHVEWFLDDPTRTHLTDYANAGVVGLIFSGGGAGTTCACDLIGDGVTNPAPINGNTMNSFNADDDGGFFRALAGAYYSAGPLALPGLAASTPSPSPAATTPPPAPTQSHSPVVTPPPSGSPIATPTSSALPTATPSPGGCGSSVGPGIPPPASVPAGVPGLHAAWYGQSGYPTLCGGQRSTATVAFYNSGSIGWVSGRLGEVAYLGTWDPEPGQDKPSLFGGDGQLGTPNTSWPRYNRIAIQPSNYVGPGQVAWFQFTIQAPNARGIYRLYLRPVIEGASWLEDYGVFWLITVR